MKPHSTTLSLIAVLICFAQSSFANEAIKREEECKIPKLLDFNLPEYTVPEKHEIAPQSEFSFRISDRGADAKKIKVMAKDKVLPLNITQNSSFIYVKGKLPAEFSGQFVRLHAFVGTELGCRGKDGWLLKISAAAGAATPTVTEPVKAVEVAPEASKPTKTEVAPDASKPAEPSTPIEAAKPTEVPATQ